MNLGVCGGPKRTLDFLALEFQVIVSFLVSVLGAQLVSSSRSSNAPTPTGSSLKPLINSASVFLLSKGSITAGTWLGSSHKL